MAQDGPNESGRPQQRNGLPSELMDIISPALQVGGLTGSSPYCLSHFILNRNEERLVSLVFCCFVSWSREPLYVLIL